MTDLRDPHFTAAIDMIGRTGAREFQIRWSGRPEDGGSPEYDEDDPVPLVWIAVAVYKDVHEADAALDPAQAVLRLAARLVDGSVCVHCKRPAGIDDRWDLPQLLPDTFCWYVYDPETKKYRRSCEGDARIGRNDPCPCGSGQKFKKCHGGSE